MLPRGMLISCPSCGTMLYRLIKDIDINDPVSDSLSSIMAVYPQPIMTPSSRIVQKCFKCCVDFNFTALMRDKFLGGK